MSRMRITLVNTLYHPYRVGGAERSVQLLAEAAVRRGHSVSVITCGERRERATIGGVRIFREPLANAYWPFSGVRRSKISKAIWHAADTCNLVMATRLRSILRSEAPDIVNTNNVSGFSSSVWLSVRSLGVPVVHTIRDYYLVCLRATLYRDHNCDWCNICRSASLVRRRLSDLPDHVITISDSLIAEHRARGVFVDTPSTTIPNFARQVAAIYAPRIFPYSTFGYLGRLDPSKGVEAMLGAFDAVRIAKPGLKLLVAGDGHPAYVRRLRGIAPPNVEFVGRVEAETLLRRIDFLIVPSEWREPLGRVVIEAYACSVPVIAARRGALPEIVEDGITGLTFESGSTTDFVRKIERAASLNTIEYTRLVNGVRSHSERYTEESVVERYLGVLSGLVCAQRSHNSPTNA